MRRLQRKILLIPICFVLLRTPETVYRVLEYLHPSPAGGAVCEADASLASSVVGQVLQGMQAITNPAQGVATSIIFVWSSPTYRERLRRLFSPKRAIDRVRLARGISYEPRFAGSGGGDLAEPLRATGTLRASSVDPRSSDSSGWSGSLASAAQLPPLGAPAAAAAAFLGTPLGGSGGSVGSGRGGGGAAAPDSPASRGSPGRPRTRTWESVPLRASADGGGGGGGGGAAADGDALAAAEDVLAPEGAVLARGGSFHPAHSPSARVTRDTTANNTARNTSDLESNDERS